MLRSKACLSWTAECAADKHQCRRSTAAEDGSVVEGAPSHPRRPIHVIALWAGSLGQVPCLPSHYRQDWLSHATPGSDQALFAFCDSSPTPSSLPLPLWLQWFWKRFLSLGTSCRFCPQVMLRAVGLPILGGTEGSPILVFLTEWVGAQVAKWGRRFATYITVMPRTFPLPCKTKYIISKQALTFSGLRVIFLKDWDWAQKGLKHVISYWVNIHKVCFPWTSHLPLELLVPTYLTRNYF